MTDPTRPRLSGPGLSVEDRDHVRWITLDRPEALNAFSTAMFTGMAAALDDAVADTGVACVVVTGNGRAFTAGSDLAGDVTDEQPAPAADPYDTFVERLESFPKPLIAAVNGLAVGIGTSMLGHCDLALASNSARFRLPFTSLGLVPEAGSTVTLPALMGRYQAAHALLTSNWVSAAQALEAGLIWRVTAPEALLAETENVCAEIASQPLESLVATKELLLAARLPAAREARHREEAEFRRMLKRPAHLEALAAFRERRAPDFGALAPDA
jgi:enoyl-CoA hydratase/carnithine racemase